MAERVIITAMLVISSGWAHETPEPSAAPVVDAPAEPATASGCLASLHACDVADPDLLAGVFAALDIPHHRTDDGIVATLSGTTDDDPIVLRGTSVAPLVALATMKNEGALLQRDVHFVTGTELPPGTVIDTGGATLPAAPFPGRDVVLIGTGSGPTLAELHSSDPRTLLETLPHVETPEAFEILAAVMQQTSPHVMVAPYDHGAASIEFNPPNQALFTAGIVALANQTRPTYDEPVDIDCFEYDEIWEPVDEVQCSFQPRTYVCEGHSGLARAEGQDIRLLRIDRVSDVDSASPPPTRDEVDAAIFRPRDRNTSLKHRIFEGDAFELDVADTFLVECKLPPGADPFDDATLRFYPPARLTAARSSESASGVSGSPSVAQPT